MRRFLWLVLASIVGIAIAPVVAPTVARIGRPIAGSGMRFSLRLYRSGRVKLEELKETLEDLLAEARSDLHRSDTE